MIQDIESVPRGISLLDLHYLKRQISRSTGYLEQVTDSCYICDKIKALLTVTLQRFSPLSYGEQFLINSELPGFCTLHYKDLYSAAPKYLNGEELNEFIKQLNQLYRENMSP